MTTKVNVFEYNGKTTHYKIPGGVKHNDSDWDACIEALSPYKSQQVVNHSIARPGKWSAPSHNAHASVLTTRWTQANMSLPHVHAGANVRAAIGCSLVRGGSHYATMTIYIGEFAKS